MFPSRQLLFFTLTHKEIIYSYVFTQVEVAFIRQFCNRIATASKSIFSFQELISISNKFSLTSEYIQTLSCALSFCRFDRAKILRFRAKFATQI